MCGIVGVYNISRKSLNAVPEHIYKDMTNALSHRGPDEVNDIHLDSIWIGFRRLSIIDISNGHQPIWNEDKTIVCICNGEIYNFKELRHSLMEKGHLFRTACDVEVLVYLYEEYTTDMFKHINGQFALMIYDLNRQELLLARDHIGICPLFYTQVNDHIIFGSEIKSILTYLGLQREVNLEGLDQIFCLPGLCSPTTMFKGINALRPGCYLLVKDGNYLVHEYWDLIFSIPPERDHSEHYYSRELYDRLERSVKYRLLVAHQDDWQLFMSPEIVTDILDEKCKTAIIHTTSGDAGKGDGFWRAREEGAIASLCFCLSSPGLNAIRH